VSQFILRFDDICPGMNWGKFERIKKIAEAFDIPCLLGVIPACSDPALISIDKQISEKVFFDKIRRYQLSGDTIAQHGWRHIYHNDNVGILGLGCKSEFAGRTFQQQRHDLECGKQKLLTEKCWNPVFMAPGHSFDEATLAALVDLEFIAITDGIALSPFICRDLVWVPQIFASGWELPLGTYTLCVHSETASEKFIQRLFKFIERNYKSFISFEQTLVSDQYKRLSLNTQYKRGRVLKYARAIRKAIQWN